MKGKCATFLANTMCKRGHLGRFGYFLLCSLCKKALFLFLSSFSPFLRGFLHFLDIEAKSLSLLSEEVLFIVHHSNFILPLPIPAATTMFFTDVSLQLDTRWKLGLVGRNGRGKTTFCACYRGTTLSREKITTSQVDGFEYFPYKVGKPRSVL